MPDVVTTVEGFGLNAVGVEEVVATQKALREGLGPHRSLCVLFIHWFVSVTDFVSSGSTDSLSMSLMTPTPNLLTRRSCILLSTDLC